MMSNPVQSSNDWKFNRTLGAGGFGTVELWMHVQSGKKFAIKKCKWDYSQLTPVQRKRWANEVDIMSRLKHPNIVKAGFLPFKLPNIENNLPILCMEYCKKGDLRKILNHPENCCGIRETEAVKVMTEVSSAVEYLHSQNITHRDLKPENIVLQDENNVLLYKLIDLGYAKELGEASLSASLVGTLNYVAPELLWQKKYSCSVDYWSLGILFYEVVTGIRPFLPKMQHTMEWMKQIQNKDYEDIHAYESEGKIIFGKDIQDPTDLSNNLRSKMVAWFRLVLQWDPHKRGRVFDESGRSDLMVFKMLWQILSKKIYEVDGNTTVKDVQLLIEKNTNIKVEHQILTDYNGAVLIESSALLVSKTNDHTLFVFKDGCYLTKDIPTLNIPAEVDKMMIQLKDELTFEVLENYYRYTIYFVREQVNLFQLYVFAFSINIDLLHQKINTFNTNMEKTLENTKTLMNQVDVIRLRYANSTSADATDRREVLRPYFDKIDKLVNAADQIKMKFISLMENNDKFRNEVQSIDYMKDLLELYSKICDVYVDLKQRNTHKTAKPSSMVKLVFEFLNVREIQLSQNINIPRQTHNLQDELLKLEKIFNSVTVMTKLYWKEYQKIAELDVEIAPQQSNSHQFANISTIELNSAIQSEDNVIYDNLVILHTMENLMAEMQKKYLEVLNIDPFSESINTWNIMTYTPLNVGMFVSLNKCVNRPVQQLFWFRYFSCIRLKIYNNYKYVCTRKGR
ncbi:PREDICTED: inhibitor of nuclear factor kappa-B kinase subunit beta-like isoform X2 [Dinoponera quadriceps]|uniref:IkappaB kinase n=1 Tax=Dinoponera quadriceps TaxID=609295 RepID=A0A6P3XYX2_DINQU|nr:PREDICTED: inhibitor of nuclear factor kappa-B kinase subunit beta-like isoform X2 [Dinoponera quadriceps]